MKAEKIRVWRCLNCGELGEIDVDYPNDCCEIEEGTGWKCNECEDIYETKKQADKCCQAGDKKE